MKVMITSAPRGLKEDVAELKNEATLLSRATGLLNNLATLENHISVLRGDLFGEGESKAEADKQPVSLEGMLSTAERRSANLCLALQSVRKRLGCNPDQQEEHER